MCIISPFSHVWLFLTLWTVAFQVPLYLGILQARIWSGLLCPPPGDIPDPGIWTCVLGLLHCQAVLYHECYLVSTGQSCCCLVVKLCPTLQPHGLQYARLPCPSLSPWLCSNLCSLSQWCLPSNHLMLCCPLLFLPSIFPNIRVFSNELALRIRWPKYWSFSFSLSPSNKYAGLISFRMD